MTSVKGYKLYNIKMLVPRILLVLVVSVCGTTTGASENTADAVHPLQPPRKQTILVFGGNGFMGASTVEGLIRDAEQFDVAIVNRGNWYWDSLSRIKPYVKHFYCDRTQPLKNCAPLLEYIQNTENFDSIIDFSAYGPFAIQEAIKILKSKANLYIYISTDSVYEVCEKKRNAPSQEIDAVRPQQENARKKLAELDDYGHRKLQCEEELQSQRKLGGVPYIALRLPDVIGPRDNTYRWWIYQLWIKLSDHIDRQLSVPSFLINQPMSLVFSDDVARVILHILKMDDTEKQTIIDQAFNLAFNEALTLPKLLNDISVELGLGDVSYSIDSSDSPTYLFPSVRRGPIDVSKAHKTLAWQPTPWKQALRQIVKFYENVARDKNFAQQRDDVLSAMESHVAADNIFKFHSGFEEKYNLLLPAHSREDL